ncbi:unnamed protein product [Adineta steineri]|uniref:Glycosyl hydrolase family 13 catalytic domain-containing protein n=1 Tax=Adineta steineri TaxID=433720 RepID=A0A816B4B9_9BILA|nr:unnamed protein product [Adineta steineri]CAF1605403.1 unnamed protein product [Adineta steineri]
MSKSNIGNLTFYCVYTRNHTESGTFQGVIDDLPRICGMGIDFVWLLPIHPIGLTNRKGSLGSPYSIDNFREINPEHGDLNDFRRLISEVHRQGMRLMIDIVFRHTSHDCLWAKEHPEWYLRDETGKPIAIVPEWSDILDLKFEGNEKTLWIELIDILKYWCELGVDGFRMDVASGVTMQFWRQARYEVSMIYPNIVWLAESTRLPYIEGHRFKRETVNTDSTLYEAFDICYDYDIYGAWRAAIADAIPIKSYLEMVRLQTTIYPNNFIKLRFLENHDQQRAAHIFRNNRLKGLAWTAFNAFNKGCFLVHAGQETEQSKTSSLFEKDWVDCKNIYPLQQFLHELIQIKKNPIIQSNNSNFTITHHSPCIVTVWENEFDRQGLIGIFNVSQNNRNEEYIQINNLPDGEYQNLLSNSGIKEIDKCESSTITISNNGKIRIPSVALIIQYSGFILQPQMFYSEIFDFDYKGM